LLLGFHPAYQSSLGRSAPTRGAVGWISGSIGNTFGQNKLATLDFAVAAVLAIAVLGAISSYIEKYMATSASQWVAHDLRRTLYDHIRRLSLAQYDETRTGDRKLLSIPLCWGRS
jgi:ABC-type transport system involved in cytochrome bd biosynthesis fused ATPase/permease subunit